VKVPSIPASSTKTIYLYYGNPSATSQSNGAAVFDFFDDFDTLDTNKWYVVSGTSYTVSNSVLKITVGAIGLQSALPFNLNSGYMTEAKVQYNTNGESAYSGVLEVASSRFIQSGNAGGDAVILYMVDSPSGSTAVRIWIGSGASASYNIANNINAFTMTLNTWYILGEETTPSGAGIWKDYSRLIGYSFTWSKNPVYIALGAFNGNGTYDIKDTSYDWVRVRKYVSPEPSITIGAEEYLLIISDSGSGAEVIMVNVTAADSGAGVDSVDMLKEALDLGAGAEYIDMLKEALDLGAGAEYIDMLKEALDSGAGYDYFIGGLYKEVYDAGAGVEYVDMSKEALDAGAGAESVNMTHEALDSGSGVDAIFSPQYNPLTDSGGGVEAALVQVPQGDSGVGFEAVNMTKEARDSGSGIDIVTQMAKAIIDSGRGVEAVYISASVAAYDSGIGTDIIGIIAQISVEDFGKGVEFADWFLGIYGMVLMDNDDIGYHSIPYKDWRQRNIPVQVHRRSVSDKVYIDSDEIGDVVVEWEDKVSDVIPGERTLIVTGVVELYD
jgi:hypothetical protein